MVAINNEYTIISNNLIWAAGVTGNVPPGLRKEIIQRGNRLKADRFIK